MRTLIIRTRVQAAEIGSEKFDTEIKMTSRTTELLHAVE